MDENRGILWEREAKLKVEEIAFHVYIKWGKASAKKFARNLNSIVKTLAFNPEIGSPVENRSPYFSFPLPPQRILYKFDPETLHIVDLIDIRSDQNIIDFSQK